MEIKNAVMIIALIFVTAGAVSQGSAATKAEVNHAQGTSEAIKIELLPRKLARWEDPAILTRPYTKRDRFFFRIKMTNTSMMPVLAQLIDPYFQNRPELYRDRQPVGYRKGLPEVLESKEKEPSTRHRGTVRLEPGESTEMEYIDLNDWYGQLKPGHYQLSVRYRFEYGQKWVESNSLTFEVVAK